MGNQDLITYYTCNVIGAGSGTVGGSGPTAAVAGPSSGAAAVVTGSGRGRANSLGSKGPAALG